MKLKKPKKKEGKERILKAAVTLFASNGYSDVGIREIAQAAGTNVSMIDYYYGGKIGVLKAIINEASEKYYGAIMEAGDDDIDPENRMRRTIRNLVDFFRRNTEMAIIMWNAFSYEIPEIIDLRVQWIAQNRVRMDRHFANLGMDIKNPVQMNVFRGLLSSIILQHFHHMYMYNRNHQVYDKIEAKYFGQETKKVEEETVTEFDDSFYEMYADTLADFYLSGVRGLINKQRKKGD